MAREKLSAKIDEALAAFQLEGQYKSHELYGNGHINDTFLVIQTTDTGERKYIMQRINHEIFADVPNLIGNIYNATEFLGKKIIEEGGDRFREALHLVDTKEGSKFYKDSIGSYWRVYDYITNSFSLDLVTEAHDFYESAMAFGRFQALLADFPADSLSETIPNFHHTPKRYENFLRAVEQDSQGRAAAIPDEIRFVKDRADFMNTLVDLQASGAIPLRVTHNDTKLNNVMFDKDTRKAICVIDLDTVMPGLSVNDYGDSIRFGASTATEDEQDLDKVRLDMNLFERYTMGFLKGNRGMLTPVELDNLVVGAKMMTLECGMRFLTDHLEGDHYFRIHRDNHNLDRSRTQFKLVAEMEENWNEMQNIVKNATM